MNLEDQMENPNAALLYRMIVLQGLLAKVIWELWYISEEYPKSSGIVDVWHSMIPQLEKLSQKVMSRVDELQKQREET